MSVVSVNIKVAYTTYEFSEKTYIQVQLLSIWIVHLDCRVEPNFLLVTLKFEKRA